MAISKKCFRKQDRLWKLFQGLYKNWFWNRVCEIDSFRLKRKRKKGRKEKKGRREEKTYEEEKFEFWWVDGNWSWIKGLRIVVQKWNIELKNTVHYLLIFFCILPPGLLPVLGPLKWYMTTLDAALLYVVHREGVTTTCFKYFIFNGTIAYISSPKRDLISGS